MPPKRKKDERYRSNNFTGALWLKYGLSVQRQEDFCTWTIPINAERYFECFQYQHEIAPNPERSPDGHHIQFFFRTKSRWTYAQLTEALGIDSSEIHCENAYDAAASWDYCGKDKKEPVCTRCQGCEPRSFGQRPKELGRGRGTAQRQQFERNYRDLIVAIDGGQSWEQLFRGPLGGFVFGRTANVKALKSCLQAPRNLPEEWSHRCVNVWFGPAGLGKSRLVREECKRFGHRLWVAPIGFNGLWFDCYDNHDAVLIDDFRGEMSFASMLNLLEGNKVLVPNKGGYAPFAPKLVYFTSDRHWNEWWFEGRDRRPTPQSDQDKAQLGRRITCTREFRGEPQCLNQALGLQGGRNNEDLSWDEEVFQELNEFISVYVGGESNTEFSPPTPPEPDELSLEQVFTVEDFICDIVNANLVQNE